MQADPHAEIDGGGQLAHQFGGASVAVNLAARVQQAAPAGATWVSSTVRDLLLGGEWTFSERGEHALKGIDGVWRLYELTA